MYSNCATVELQFVERNLVKNKSINETNHVTSPRPWHDCSTTREHNINSLDNENERNEVNVAGSVFVFANQRDKFASLVTEMSERRMIEHRS